MPALTNTGPAPRSPPWGWPGFGILAWIVACTDPTRPADAAIALPGLTVAIVVGHCAMPVPGRVTNPHNPPLESRHYWPRLIMHIG